MKILYPTRGYAILPIFRMVRVNTLVQGVQNAEKLWLITLKPYNFTQPKINRCG